MAMNYKKLWRKGGYDRDNPLKNTLAYLRKHAESLSLPIEAYELVVMETFQELELGKGYSILGCSCGCELDYSGSAITHAMRDKLSNIQKEIEDQVLEMINRRYNKMNEDYYEKKNQVPWYKKRVF